MNNCAIKYLIDKYGSKPVSLTNSFRIRRKLITDADYIMTFNNTIDDNDKLIEVLVN